MQLCSAGPTVLSIHFSQSHCHTRTGSSSKKAQSAQHKVLHPTSEEDCTRALLAFGSGEIGLLTQCNVWLIGYKLYPSSKLFISELGINIAKGTMHPRVEFCLPKKLL